MIIKQVRSAIVATLTLAGIMVAASAALANTQAVTFNTTVNPACFLTNPVNGKLGLDFDNNTLSSTAPASALTSNAGASASLTVTCNTTTGASYRVLSTTNNTAFTGAINPTSITVTAASNLGTSTATGTTSTGAGNAVTINTTTPTLINIDLSAVYPSLVPAGDYSFDVVIEALP